MINYKNLRPGNLINYQGEVLEVSSVSAGFEPPVIIAGTRIDTEYSNIVYLDPKHIDEIPFTQEWQERFNLVKMVINGFFVDVSEYGGYGFFVVTDIESEPMGKLELCRIKGVHHAQNLFLENTGYELKIVK